jgi:hypothetical protein
MIPQQSSVRGPLNIWNTREGQQETLTLVTLVGGAAQHQRVDRIDYSNDSATASIRGPLTALRWNIAATGNSNFGYFGGGYAGPTFSRVDRIDYSNDSASASIRDHLALREMEEQQQETQTLDILLVDLLYE